MIYFYYIFLILLLFLFILKNIKVILYYFGGKYKSLGINSNCYTGILPNRDAPFWAILKKQFGDKEEISQYFVLKLKLYIFSPFSNCIAQNFAQKGASLLGEKFILLLFLHMCCLLFCCMVLFALVLLLLSLLIVVYRNFLLLILAFRSKRLCLCSFVLIFLLILRLCLGRSFVLLLLFLLMCVILPIFVLYILHV